MCTTKEYFLTLVWEHLVLLKVPLILEQMFFKNMVLFLIVKLSPVPLYKPSLLELCTVLE